MKDVKLAKNFSLSEFAKKEVTSYQIQLLTVLAKQLQKVRDSLQSYRSGKKAVSISIASGVRYDGDYERLKKQGLNPAKNSDHFCGLQVGAVPTLGAADIHVNNCQLSLKDVALLIKSMCESGDVRFGQIIYEENPKTGGKWIHLSNDPEYIFNKEVIKVTRKKFLMSLDNGKTFKLLKA